MVGDTGRSESRITQKNRFRNIQSHATKSLKFGMTKLDCHSRLRYTAPLRVLRAIACGPNENLILEVYPDSRFRGNDRWEWSQFGFMVRGKGWQPGLFA